MNKLVKKFIEENKDLIENNEWEEIYFKIYMDYPERIGQFTKILLDAEINPLDYLNVVPLFYLSHSDIEDFQVPEGIESIGMGSFRYCVNLISIRLPSTLHIIERDALEGCIHLSFIKFNGTRKQWSNVVKETGWEFGVSENCTIQFTDGSFRLKDII